MKPDPKENDEFQISDPTVKHFTRLIDRILISGA